VKTRCGGGGAFSNDVTLRSRDKRDGACFEHLFCLLWPGFITFTLRPQSKTTVPTILHVFNQSSISKCLLGLDISTMKVKIVSYHAVAAWRWDLPDDDLCGICRVQFDGTCPKCKFPGDDCPIIMGACGHSFHMHCLDTWINQESSQGKCPMCRQVFKVKGTDKAIAPASAEGQQVAT
jgi:anaphase-promoting complex subunit 11